MANDRLNELTPITISFVPGERPTDEKLTGMMQQLETGLDFVELSFGDLYNESLLGPVWTNNLARDLGDHSKLNPVMKPDVVIANYEQQLTQGENEHELDLVPLGIGQAIIVATTDSSVIPSQFKNTEEELEVPGDWTIRAGAVENGQTKNSRKLITHQPSTGGTITFAQMTSGKGSAYHGATWNTIPSIAQAEAGGDFATVVLSDAPNNIYTFTLPNHASEYNRLNDIQDASASNTLSDINPAEQYKLPGYLFDVDGANVSVGDDIPLGSIRIYDWSNKQFIEGIVGLTASSNPSALRNEFLVQFRSDVLLAPNTNNYIVVVSGTSLYDMVSQLQRDVYFHKHDGDDMLRQLSHKALMGLRTGNIDAADRTAWYGTSNIHNNDHSMYLHRDGFTDSDIGAGGNVMRGAIVIGNTDTGDASDHENYNLLADSYKVAFGEMTDGGEIYFDKVWDQSLTLDRGNIPQNFSDSALVIRGALDVATTFINTVAIEGNLRVTDDVVLGTTADHDVIVSGDLYVFKSMTLAPKDAAYIAALPAQEKEEGKMMYSTTERAPVFYNGTTWVNPASSGYSATVGDSVVSQGKFNSNDYGGNGSLAIQAAINEVEAAGGGKILVQRGTYSLDANALSTITLTSNVELEGEGESTLIQGDIAKTQALFTFPAGSTGCAIRNMKASTAQFGVVMDGTLHDIDNVVFDNFTVGRSIQPNTSKLTISGTVRYENCDEVEQNSSLNENNYESAKNPIGFHNSLYILDPINKELALEKIKRTSGNGVMTYEDSTDSGYGRGRYAITGIGTWIVDELTPAIPGLGIGGHSMYKVAGGTSATVQIGLTCFNASGTALGTKYFLANTATSSTAWVLNYNHLRDEGTGSSNFVAGTKFIKPTINITSNTGTVYIDAYNIQTLNYAVRALYS